MLFVASVFISVTLALESVTLDPVTHYHRTQEKSDVHVTTVYAFKIPSSVYLLSRREG